MSVPRIRLIDYTWFKHMTEFKDGDRVRFINDIEQRMIGTVRAIHKGHFVVMVEWDDPNIVTYPYYDAIYLVETND